MNDPRPDVSVIIPVRNGAGTIRQQLDGLEEQRTTARWELILADNGSSDGTATLAHAHPLVDRLRIVDASHREGINVARNLGAAAARAPLLLFCDADDVVSPTWLEGLRAALSDAELVTGPLEYDSLNSPAARRPPPCDDGPMLGLGWRPFAYGANLGVRSEVFTEVGGFDEAYLLGGDDVDFSWRVEMAGYRLGFAPDALVHYRLKERPRDIFRQARRYGAGDARLYQRFRSQGLGRRRTVKVLKGWIRLLTLDLKHLAHGAGRTRWLFSAGNGLGCLMGSFRNRVWYP